MPTDSLFCPSCGTQTKNFTKDPEVDKNQNNSPKNKKQQKNVEQIKTPITKFKDLDLSLKIPTITGKKILNFKEECISYESKVVDYKDLEGISCKQIYHSVNLIPTNQEYSFVFYGSNSKISVNFGTTLHLGSESRKEVFTKIYIISKQLLIPIILMKIVKDLVDNDKIVTIGEVNFTKEGYYKKGFLSGEKWVYWTEPIGEPSVTGGLVTLYKSDGEKYKSFAGIPVETYNALVVPDLISSMYSIKNNL